MSDFDYTDDAEPASSVHKCSICGKPLSRYNDTGQCFHHPDPGKAQRQEEREELRIRAVAKASRDELTAMAIQTKQESLARRAGEKLADNEEDEVRQELIFDLVCQEFEVSRDEILQPSRKTLFVEARQVLMYLLYHDTSLSYPRIGERLGGKDHTTVMHGANKIEAEIQNNQMLADRIQKIRSFYQIET